MKGFAVAAAAALGLLLSTQAFAAGKQDFTLVNKTGYEIDQVYVAKSSSDDWGDDILGKDTMPNGSSEEIEFTPKDSSCMWDLMVVWTDKTKAEWEKINLCEVEKVTIKYDRKTDKASVDLK